MIILLDRILHQQRLLLVILATFTLAIPSSPRLLAQPAPDEQPPPTEEKEEPKKPEESVAEDEDAKDEDTAKEDSADQAEAPTDQPVQGDEPAKEQPVTPTDSAINTGELNNKELFADFLHNAVIGKFDRADAFAKKLIANNPDPLEILQYSDEYTNSLKTLILLVNKIEVSDSAKQVMALIESGERLRRQDPERIKLNIEKLGGDPQTEFNAIKRLQESGEYAVPWLISTLQDKAQAKLHPRIIRMLPKMGKEAVNPMVIALTMTDNDTKAFLAKALGDIGYPQALAYLKAVLENPQTTAELKSMIEDAILKLVDAGEASAGSASESYLSLARQYYADHGSVQYDPRAASANVWYWIDGRLQRIEVPRIIFNDIMAMRCCEEALRLQPESEQAVALWLAANIRREAELGMNVESAESDPNAAADTTKPENYPRSAYFARAAGARYNHMVLDLAIQHREPAVALGAIASLRLIAGESNLIGTEDIKQPLAQALTFPDLAVRLKAALALAQALPTQPFTDSDRVIPTLAEALAQTGGLQVLVVEPDQQNMNRVMEAIRDDQTHVIGEQNFLNAINRARKELPAVSAIFLASDMTEPELGGAVSTLRSNNQFALTPIVILTKQGQIDQVANLVKADSNISSVVATADDVELDKSWQKVLASASSNDLDPAEALKLAISAVDAIRKLAISRTTLFDLSLAESALIDTLARQEEVLRTSAAATLGLFPSSQAQQAIAKLALDGNTPESLRVSAFGSLADSAKIHGNLLSEDLTDKLIDLAINEPNLVIRSAGSQALGALNIPSNKASQIINKFYRK